MVLAPAIFAITSILQQGTWTVDTLIALILAILVSILSLAGVVSGALVANATVATLAVLAFIMLHDRKLQEGTRELVQRLTVKFDEQSPVRTLTGPDINRAIVEAHKNTDQWLFRGSTATYVRVVIFPHCIQRARRAGREFRARLEILDPTNAAACDNHNRLFQSIAVGSGDPKTRWTMKGTRIELYATILATCWYRQRYEPFAVEIGLSTTASTFRWEASSEYFIITQRWPQFPAMLIDRKDPFYTLFVSELNASFRQTRKVPLERAVSMHLSDEPTIEETRTLFSRLEIDLPSDFDDSDVSEIIIKALHGENRFKEGGFNRS
jgi:hypothetical protein